MSRVRQGALRLISRPRRPPARLPACWTRERRWLIRRCASRRQPPCDRPPCTAPPGAMTRLQMTMPCGFCVLWTVYLRCCTHTRPQCVCSESPQPSATGPSLRPPAPMAQRPITHSVMAGSVWMKRLKRAGRRPRGSRGVQRSGDVAALLHRTESREGGPPTATSLPACCPPGSPRRATSRRHCQSRRPAAAPPRRD